MTNVIIVGSGAVAAELTSYIEDNNRNVSAEEQFHLAGYLEFPENVEKYWAKYGLTKPVLGDVHTYSLKTDDRFLIGIADVAFRKKMTAILQERSAVVTGFVHHTTIVADTAQVGPGTIIYPHCIIGPNTQLGEHNFITSYSFISHDCTVGDNNFFSTAGLGGRVNVGNDNFFGIRSTIIPGVTVGSNNIIQAGMVVDKDVEDGATVFHRFKEKVVAVPKN